MKIKLLIPIAGSGFCYRKNDIVDFPDKLAKKYIAAGFALSAEEEAPKSKPVEVKEAPPVEETPVIETKKKTTRKKKETE